MKKELLRVALGKDADLGISMDALDMVIEVRGHGELLLDQLKALIPGSIDDSVIDALKEFLRSQQALAAAK